MFIPTPLTEEPPLVFLFIGTNKAQRVRVTDEKYRTDGIFLKRTTCFHICLFSTWFLPLSFSFNLFGSGVFWRVGRRGLEGLVSLNFLPMPLAFQNVMVKKSRYRKPKIQKRAYILPFLFYICIRKIILIL